MVARYCFIFCLTRFRQAVNYKWACNFFVNQILLSQLKPYSRLGSCWVSRVPEPKIFFKSQDLAPLCVFKWKMKVKDSKDYWRKTSYQSQKCCLFPNVKGTKSFGKIRTVNGQIRRNFKRQQVIGICWMMMKNGKDVLQKLQRFESENPYPKSFYLCI